MAPVPLPFGRRSGYASLFTLALVATSLSTAAAVPAGNPPVSEELTDLLRRSDVSAHEPASFRSRLLLQGPGHEAPLEIEVWRRGGTRTLVRFLGAKHRGRYLLYLEEGVFFLAPGARSPVRLPRSFRLHGSATLDDVLGLRYARDYAIRSAEPGPASDQVTFELEARSAKAPYPRVRYVVDRRTARPVRAELRLRGGKLATSVEYLAWSEGAVLRPRRLVLRDHLRGGAATQVELLDFEERSVPEGLFSLTDGGARRRLEEQEPASLP